ncbi:hypothetical protein WISP_11626 [Willisornis vidua]|uniref:Uncharacterized protein n=1 Tax=Willisornis vidua TaxID=1566151 RepID=A0ABQ9DWV1_9PASS|nr:hypothetical protein WISP_11626 [Willisornis vidua]
MLQAWRVMVLTHCLLPFLLALQAEDAQSAPVQGQVAEMARRSALPAAQQDSMLIPSWYLKEMEPETMQEETFQVGESDKVPDSDEEREAIQGTRTPSHPEDRPERSASGEHAETSAYQEFGKNCILGTAVVFSLLLLGIMVGFLVISLLMRRDTESKSNSSLSAEKKDIDIGSAAILFSGRLKDA